jgi:hypothetical protein
MKTVTISILKKKQPEILITFIGPGSAKIFAEYNQQDTKFLNLFISGRRSTCFRREELKTAHTASGICQTNAARGQVKCNGTRAETIFRLSAKRTSPFKSAGASGLFTTGSRRLRISAMFRGSDKGTGYPLHSTVSPSLPLPCVTVCHHISAGVYLLLAAGSSIGLTHT